MVTFKYDGDLIGGSLMVRESRIVAELMLNQASQEEWDQAIRVDNRLQKRSIATASRIAGAIRKRLERLEPEFWRAIKDGDEQLATQVTFAAALNRNLLLVEFMEHMMRDAYVTHTKKLAAYLWADFLEERIDRDPDIQDWKESSKKKMGQVVFRMLVEMGYLENSRNRILHHVVIRPEIKVMLEDTYRQRIKKCMEVSYKGNF